MPFSARRNRQSIVLKLTSPIPLKIRNGAFLLKKDEGNIIKYYPKALTKDNQKYTKIIEQKSKNVEKQKNA